MLVRVLSATTVAQPGSPAEGDVYIVPASATGTDWAGQDGKIAHYYGGAWHTYTPPEGLGIYSTGDAAVYRYLAGAWAEEAAAGGASAFTELTDVPTSYAGQAGLVVAVKTAEDGLEYIAAAGGGADAFTELTDTPGSYTALAGLIVAVNPTEDGLEFVEAPAGAARNYLINPEFTFNQRGFAGGSVSDGEYCFDRWRASGASSFTAIDGSGYVTLTSGTIEQVVEAPDLAGKQVTLAADTGGTTVTGDVDGTSGTLPLTVDIDAGSTGDIAVSLTGGKVKAVQLVEGAAAGDYQARHPTEELLLCQRYYAKSYPSAVDPGSVAGGHPYCFAIGTGKDLHLGNVMAPVEMRASPTVTLYSPNDGTADAIYNETGAANHVAAAVGTTANCIGYPQIDAGASAPSADDLFGFHWTADAEI